MENKDTLKEFIFKMKNQVIFFNLLNEEEVQQIIPYFEVVTYSEGSTIFNEGDQGDFIAIILSGLLEVKKHTEFKGKQIIIAALREGSFVGEMSLINEKEPRSATVVARKDSELITLKREALESLIQKYPYIGIKILKGLNQILSIRLRKASERMTGIF